MTCSTSALANASPRISARRGQVANLNVEFFNNGVLADPYAIRKVEIYKSAILPHNLVTTIPIIELEDAQYPAPLCQPLDDDDEAAVGKYHLLYSVPPDLEAPNVYFDLWYYFATNPCGEVGTDVTSPTDCNIDSEDYEPLLLKCCHQFFVYPDEWMCDSRLQSINFGFEPLSQKFHQPENRTLEVGIMPLPLYDYNFNLVNPMIPFIKAYITVKTQHCELLVDEEPCRIGLRQGSYRTNPYVVQYDLDTMQFLKGTYQYQIKLVMPNGMSRVSCPYIMTIF